LRIMGHNRRRASRRGHRCHLSASGPHGLHRHRLSASGLHRLHRLSIILKRHGLSVIGNGNRLSIIVKRLSIIRHRHRLSISILDRHRHRHRLSASRRSRIERTRFGSRGRRSEGRSRRRSSTGILVHWRRIIGIHWIRIHLHRIRASMGSRAHIALLRILRIHSALGVGLHAGRSHHRIIIRAHHRIVRVAELGILKGLTWVREDAGVVGDIEGILGKTTSQGKQGGRNEERIDFLN